MPAETVQTTESPARESIGAAAQSATPAAEVREVASAAVRVMHVINGEHYSGAERVQDLLGQHLPAFGYEAAFACVKPGRFADRRQDQDSPVYAFPMASRVDWHVARKLSRLVNDEGYSLVHAHTPRSALVGRLAAWLAKVPMIYHVHSPTSQDTTDGWRNRLNDWTERASRIDHRVAQPRSTHAVARLSSRLDFRRPQRSAHVHPTPRRGATFRNLAHRHGRVVSSAQGIGSSARVDRVDERARCFGAIASGWSVRDARL